MWNSSWEADLTSRRMWSGFSSEIETDSGTGDALVSTGVACGAASRLRLKHRMLIAEAVSFYASHVERLLV